MCVWAWMGQSICGHSRTNVAWCSGRLPSGSLNPPFDFLFLDQLLGFKEGVERERERETETSVHLPSSLVPGLLLSSRESGVPARVPWASIRFCRASHFSVVLVAQRRPGCPAASPLGSSARPSHLQRGVFSCFPVGCRPLPSLSAASLCRAVVFPPYLPFPASSRRASRFPVPVSHPLDPPQRLARGVLPPSC